MAKGVRPSTCYKWDSPAYTRVSKNPSNSFITGIPGSKIIHYDMGNRKAKFDTEVSIVPKERIMVRHNALEATRIVLQKMLEQKVGVSNYLMKVRVFPHHIMRENAMATGAGADRVQSGMRGAFGKPIGRAARVKVGQPIFTIYINKTEERLSIAQKALKTAIKKLPGDLRITISEAKK